MSSAEASSVNAYGEHSAQLNTVPELNSLNTVPELGSADHCWLSRSENDGMSPAMLAHGGGVKLSGSLVVLGTTELKFEVLPTLTVLNRTN